MTSTVLAVLFVVGWIVQGTPEDWWVNLLQACALLALVAVAVLMGDQLSQARYATIREVLARMEDQIDATHFRLFEERTERTGAERFFDERRRDPEYDHAYRQAWRALRNADTDGADVAGDTDPHGPDGDG